MIWLLLDKSKSTCLAKIERRWIDAVRGNLYEEWRHDRVALKFEFKLLHINLGANLKEIIKRLYYRL